MREVAEAQALGRPIVPVFSQDFEPPPAIPPLLAQAIEYNGVSMDTQFHVAAFDQLSHLVGGRKRSEQRRRVAVLASLAILTLVTSLVLDAREIVRLSGDVSREHDVRQAAEEESKKSRADEEREADQRQRDIDARSDRLAQELAASEERRLDEQRAADQRLREAEARSERLAQELSEIEKRRQAQIRTDTAETARRDQAAQKHSAECRGSAT